jgi:hypothetical protein
LRLFYVVTARRFTGLALLLFFSVPFGLSVTGCGHKSAPPVYCNAGDSGPTVGQVASITLSPSLATTGESLNYGQIGQALSASAVDCKGNSVSVSRYTYASSDSTHTYADINPSTGQICAGTWNRNTGGGIADYTFCTAPATLPSTNIAYVTATAAGAVSNAIPVYVHPVVTSIVLGGSTPSGSCPTTANPLGNDPGTDCCPNSTSGTPVVAPVYTGTSCISQNTTGQLIARVYQGGTTTPANNITCQVGHITFSPQSSNIVSIDQNGVVTANQPGSTIITANLSNSSSGASAGFFATCPPASITLSVPGQPAGTGSVNVSVNNLQPLTAVVTDKNNVVLSGLSLEFNSTTPQTIPAAVGSVTPTYPGTAVITAVCQPGACNPSPFSQIGLYGNGEPITSNGIAINVTGTASTVIYMGSTSSQYVLPMDFTTNQPSSFIKLPYVPNSMVITQDGNTIYLGSTQGLMSISTASNAQGTFNESVPGTVLSVSPDGTTVVITDPVRQTVSLYSPSSSAIYTSYGAVGTSAKWSPDTQTVYITTTTGIVLTHSAFTNWQTTAASETYTNVAVTVPSVGAYFSGPSTLDGRSYCPSGVATGTGTPQTVNNTFTPLADTKPVPAQTLATTNDGLHVLSANVTANTTTATLSDLGLINGSGTTSLPVTTACPGVVTPGYFPSTLLTPAPLTLTGVTATTINGIIPAANSSQAFITYTGSSDLLPQYVPSHSGAGTLSFIKLGNGATTASAPVSGVFSTDGLTFYVGTGASTNNNSADNDVHILSINGTAVTETGILSPVLPPASGTGAAAPVNLLVQKPKKSQI